MANQRTAEQERERKKKAAAAIQKKTKELAEFHKKKDAEKKSATENRKPGHMSQEELKKFYDMTKEERRALEKKLELEQEKKPYLLDKLGKQRQEDTKRYESGQMNPEEKKKYEANKPVMSAIQSLNPHLKFDDQGRPIIPEQEFLSRTPGTHINMPILTDQQIEFSNSLRDMVSGQLPGLMKQFSQPASMDMFNHMSNPVLQKMMNPQVLFPSQMQNQMNPGIENLLSQLGMQAMQYGIDKAPDAWNYAQQNAPALYEGAKGMGNQALQYGQKAGGNIMDLLSGLANRFRGPQQPMQQ